MADDKTDEKTSAPAPAKAVAAAKSFVARHGGEGRAVVQNLGRAGARVVLIGGDGAFGDVVVADVEAGEAVVAAVEDLSASEWDSDTTGALAIGAGHRRKMATMNG